MKIRELSKYIKFRGIRLILDNKPELKGFLIFYNVTKILKLYYNLIKTIDNIEKKNKILVERLKLAKWE